MTIPFPLHFPNQIFKEYRELSSLLRKSLTIVITKHLYSKNIQRNNGVEKGLEWGLRGGVRSLIIILKDACLYSGECFTRKVTI